MDSPGTLSHKIHNNDVDVRALHALLWREMDGCIVYGDTDSVMVTNPASSTIKNDGKPDAQTRHQNAHYDACKRICEKVNAFSWYPHQLEDENTIENFLPKLRFSMSFKERMQRQFQCSEHLADRMQRAVGHPMRMRITYMLEHSDYKNVRSLE